MKGNKLSEIRKNGLRVPSTPLPDIQLVVCDLDGTLLTTDKYLDDQIIEVNKHKKYRFTIASGRSAILVKSYIEQLQLQLPYITNNGAELFDKDQKCIQSYTITSKELSVIVQLVHEMKIECYACSDQMIYTIGEANVIKPLRDRFAGKLTIIESAALEQICMDSIHKLVCMHQNLTTMEDFARQVNTLCTGSICIRSEGNAFNIVNRQASKGKTLLDLMSLLNIQKEHVLVFGDNYNDLSMFQEAGYSVAMENADREVKDKAAFITRGNDQNGVSYFLKHFVE